MLLVDKESPVVSRKLTLGTLASYIAALSSTVPSARLITCTAPLLCDDTSAMDLTADRTLSITGPNIKTINVACTGAGAADTAARDAALTSLQALNGGVLHFSGACSFTTRLVNDPASGTTSAIMLEGDGRINTSLTFSACTGGVDCILLGCESGIGSGRCDGSGMRNMSVFGPSDKTLIHLKGLQAPLLSNVYTVGGDISLWVEESRYGPIENDYFWNPTTSAIKITGELFASNWYKHIEISTAGSAGSAISYIKAGVSDAGGVYLDHVVVNGTWAGSGMLFQATTANNVFVFINHSAIDGNFASDGVKFVKVIKGYVTDSHITNQASATGASALTLDASSAITLLGSQLNGSTGTGGSDLSLKNSVSQVVVDTTRLVGNQQALRVDGTTHDIDLRPSSYLSSTFTNDATKLVPSTSIRFSTPPTFYTGSTTKSMLGMIDPAGSLAQYQDVDSSGVFHIYANNGSTALVTLTQTGDVSFVGKAGIGTTSADSPLTVTANVSALPTPISGTLVHLANADSTATRATFQAFGSSASIDGMRADGTAASMSGIGGSTEVIIALAAFGHDTTGITSSARANLQLLTDGVWSGSSTPTAFRVNTTPSGATASRVGLIVDNAGHMACGAAAPTVSCTGTGTSPASPTIDSGGTDCKFTITMNTGTGSPSSTGTCTVTFGSAYAANKPIMVCMLVDGASAWGNESVVRMSAQSLTAPVLSWTNEASGSLTGLTTSTNYKISCIALQ